LEPVDLEKQIGELEIALDRLRSLYDQYFVGLEKIVPAVLRKDVDRRFYLLRREQIRNTALRFRFQMVLQRYNTYQTYWQRICREIENGTYKRHLIRAQRRFGSTRPGRDSVPPPAPDHPVPAAPGVSHDLVAQLVGLDGGFAPPSFEVDIQMEEEGPIAGVPPPQRLPAPPAGRPAPAASKAAPAVWKKMPPAPGAPSASAAGPAAAGPAAAAAPARPPMPAAAPAGIRAPAPAPSSAPTAVRGPAPASPSAGGPVPTLAGVPVTTPSRAPAPATMAAPSPVAAPVPASPRAAHAATTPPRPASPPRPTPSVAPPVTTPPADLPEERLRAIYAEYVGAKRSQNESTAAITYQAVARSLRESGDKLRKKHGKAVDFEVAVKDGKTILRPVLK
jgi:hypothetical protein